jgi:hypothetical protein
MSCRYCGTVGPCRPDCDCAKCRDPEAWADWRNDHHDEYLAWLGRSGVNTECPGCGRDFDPKDLAVCEDCFDHVWYQEDRRE